MKRNQGIDNVQMKQIPRLNRTTELSLPSWDDGVDRKKSDELWEKNIDMGHSSLVALQLYNTNICTLVTDKLTITKGNFQKPDFYSLLPLQLTIFATFPDCCNYSVIGLLTFSCQYGFHTTPRYHRYISSCPDHFMPGLIDSHILSTA